MSEEMYNTGVVMSVTSPSCPGGQLYTVKSGDTMYFIAKRYNISLQALITANPQISDPNLIYPGQMICIPVAPPVVCPSGQLYTVVKGDTMYEIAKRFGISLDALVDANPQIADPNLIYPGQEICVPAAPSVPCPNGTLYTVVAGDTLFKIAERNQITLAALIAANPQIADPNRINVGQVICIPKPSGVIGIPYVPVPMPSPMPTPLPAPMPCPPGHEMPMMYPCPVYVVVPWDECPYRARKKRKHDRRKKCC